MLTWRLLAKRATWKTWTDSQSVQVRSFAVLFFS